MQLSLFGATRSSICPGGGEGLSWLDRQQSHSNAFEYRRPKRLGNIDLSGNKELKFGDLFKPGSDYITAIAKYVSADIDRRLAAIEQEEAQRAGRPPKQRDEPLVSMEQLSELSGWALTPKGLVVYFDFPHVMAAFDRTFIPYGVVFDHLKPNGPAARFQKP